jgi:putative nucleotidyltransferase with HDIG domain
MNKNKVSQIRQYVKEQYHESDYKYHILVVVRNALKLAKLKNANLEIVEIAALLHDIGRVSGLKPSGDNEHHITGAKIAGEYLGSIKYPKEKAEKVISCILAHRGSKDDYTPQTIEEIIIYNADATSHLYSFLDLFKEFLLKEGDFESTVILMGKKIDRAWNKKLTLPEAKKLVEKEYRAARLLIDNALKNHD